MSESLPDERALIERAHQLELEGQYNQALDIVNRILFSNPENGEARRALLRLRNTEPDKGKVVDIYETPPSNEAIQELVRQNQQLIQQVQEKQSGQQVVHVTNQTAFIPPPPSRVLRAERNDPAFIIGVIAGFFGLLGLAHLFNGKVGSGLALIFLGTPIYGFGWFIILSTGIGIIAIPLHFVIIWQSAKSGARHS